MKLLRILPLVVGSAVAGILAITSPAHALTTWSFNNATFDNGARVTGSFDYDNTITNSSAADGYLNVNITLYNNLNAILATYNTANISAASDADELYLNNGGYGLFAGNAPSYWDDPLSGGTGTLAIGGNAILAYGLGTAPGFTTQGTGNSGTISAAPASVPFDIPGGATIPTVGSLLALGAMRKVKKSIASKTSIASPV